jgi:two-component system NtrC family sensor kinase
MRLFHKLAILLITTSVIPITTIGFSLVAKSERTLEREVRARFDELALHAAESLAADLEGRARLIARMASIVPWDRLSPDEAQGALALIRAQTNAEATAIDNREGRLVATDPAKGSHVLADLAQAPRLRARKEKDGAVVFSSPFRRRGGSTKASPIADVVVAAALVVRDFTLSLILPLAEESDHLEMLRRGRPLALELIDEQGRIILSSPAGVAAPTPAVWSAVRRRETGFARRYRGDTSAKATLAAFVPVGSLDWTVVVEMPAALAFAEPVAMRRETLFWTGGVGLLGLLLAFLSARRLTAALEHLSDAADRVAAGDLDARTKLSGTDEVNLLGKAFDRMGEQLKEGRAEIDRWNRELEARVENRTKELKSAQAQLVQAQKLAALGQLGAGVAHEINNPLGAVIGHVELLLTERGIGHPDREALVCIEEGARRAAQVVQNLLRFSIQREEPIRTTMDANRVVRETLSLTERLITDQGIELRLELGTPAPRLLADQGQFAQVLLNLVANARASMREGMAVQQDAILTIRTRLHNEHVLLEVADTGCGITSEIRDRIFEPFFTTKAEWSNVGLGLSVSYRIVEEHGGRIAFESTPGRGSTFSVYWPTS